MYILEKSIIKTSNNSKEIISSMDGESVKDRELFFKKDYYNNILDSHFKFDYLLPKYMDEYKEVEFICDFHNWINYKPNLYSFIISEKMKNILEQFDIHKKQFYNAKVLFEDKYHDYQVWHLFLDGFNEYVDFKQSIFCEYNYEHTEKKGLELFKVNNQEELTDLEYNKNWDSWGFERAVMKPEFKEIDCMAMPYPYGILISERLKNELEEAKLTGFEIKPFPVDFEYL
ncbi:hypothetical protein [Dokdonia sp.]|uniref:hypothetical protein n=1 Tax=Dokdonia sp. TaxID=2024995 RepID=UPI003265CCA7